MTAHIVVPSLDSAPATVSRGVLTNLLRGELGFDGLVLTDALEMRGLADSVGIEEGAVLSLAAGADALCLGHDLGDDWVERVCRAIVDAVESGRLGTERLAEAAGRVDGLTRWSSQARPVEVRRGVGLDAARRALRVEGDVLLGGAARLVSLLPEPNIAAGVHEHSLAGLLDAGDEDGRWVVVLRDAHRYEEARAETERLLEAHPDAVLVETGLPLWRPSAAHAYVATNGAGRVNLEAAAEAMRGRA